MSSNFADATMDEITDLLAEPLYSKFEPKIAATVAATVDLKVKAAMDQHTATDRPQLKSEIVSEILDLIKLANEYDSKPKARALPRAKSAPSTSMSSSTFQELLFARRAESPQDLPFIPEAKQPRIQPSDDDTISDDLDSSPDAGALPFDQSDPVSVVNPETAAAPKITLLKAQIKAYTSRIPRTMLPATRRDIHIHIMGQAYGKIHSHHRCKVPGSKVTAKRLLLEFLRTEYKITDRDVERIKASTYVDSDSNTYKFTISPIPKVAPQD
jgi:hypothetical protein